MRIRKTVANVPPLNVTPLIDVVFILLVFFMLATNFASYRLIRVETPRETDVVTTSEGAIVIAIRAGAAITFDGEPIEEADLPAAIAEVVAIDPGRTFLIRPYEDVSLQEAIVYYEVARRAGATAVSFSPPKDSEAP